MWFVPMVPIFISGQQCWYTPGSLCNDRVVLDGRQPELPDVEHGHELGIVVALVVELAEHKVVEERVVHLTVSDRKRRKTGDGSTGWEGGDAAHATHAAVALSGA